MKMWYKQPLLAKQAAARVAIEEIYKTVPFSEKRITEFGLTNGYLGLSVFCYLYGVHAGKESCFKQSAALFEKAVNRIGTHPLISALDLTELALVCQLLFEAKVTGYQPNCFLEEIDAYLLDRMRQAIIQVDIGGISNGAVGFGFYFFSRARFDPQGFKAVIQELAAALEACSITSQKECHWYPDQFFPLPLWNGQSAVILFLTAAANQGYIERKQVCPMLGKAINFLTYQLKMQPASTFLSFQMGDLGSAYALLRAGQVFENEQWLESGLEFLGKRAGFCLANAGTVKHAGMLAGASGAALAFNKVYALTGIELFGAAAELCFAKLLGFYQDRKVDHLLQGSNSDLCFGSGNLGAGAGLIKSLHRNEVDFDHLLWLI